MPTGRRPEYAAAFDMLRRPTVRLFVVHERGGETGLLRTPLFLDEEEKGCILAVEHDDGVLRWTTEFDLPEARLRDLGPGRLVGYIEELDRRMPATYVNEPVAPEDMFKVESFVDSGAAFQR